LERKDERVKKSEFDIKMKTNDMFAFMLRQQYSGMRGIIVLLLNIIVVICLVLKWTDYDTTAKILMFFILIIFDIYLPGQLFVRAKS
jgi:tryptophan-rich sensory protein